MINERLRFCIILPYWPVAVGDLAGQDPGSIIVWVALYLICETKD